MSYPRQSELIDPLICAIYLMGGTAEASESRMALAKFFGLSYEEIIQPISASNSQGKWLNIVQYVSLKAKTSGLLYKPRHGIWSLTDKGQEHATRLIDLGAYPNLAAQLDETGIRQKRVAQIPAPQAKTEEGKPSVHSATKDVVGGKGERTKSDVVPKRALPVRMGLEAFLAAQREAEEIGMSGELYVLKQERRRLEAAGRQDLARAIRHVSLEDVGAGYDVASYTPDGVEKHIEVKTSKGAIKAFAITDNELKAARRLRKAYWLYLVSNIGTKDVSVEEIPDPAPRCKSGEFELQPVKYNVVRRNQRKRSLEERSK